MAGPLPDHRPPGSDVPAPAGDPTDRADPPERTDPTGQADPPERADPTDAGTRTGLAHPGLAAARTPDKPAVIMAETGEQLTFAEYDALANQVSHLFRAAGLRPGDTVALLMTNRLRYLPIVSGATYAGLRYVPVSTRLGPEEVLHLVEDSGAAMLLCSADLAPLGERFASLVGPAGPTEERDGPADPGAAVEDPGGPAGSSPGPRLVAVDGAIAGYESLDELLAGRPTTPLPEERMQGGAMMYSSGTTGRQKGVWFPVATKPLGSPIGITAFCRTCFGIGPDVVYLSPAPLYHSAPHGFSTVALADGATVVVMQRFEPAAFLAAIERHRITHTQLVPTFFVRLLALPERERRAHDLSSLQVAVHAAAPCPVEIKRRMIDWWGPILREYYGGTERIGLTYCDSREWLAHPGTVGRAVMNEPHICAEDGTELPTGTDGLIYFAGRSPFRYHNDEAKTRSARHPEHENWASYGDIGHLDEDGYLYLTDRSAFMIISGGVNIYPQEAENVLAAHPKVADVAVFGIPHPEMGEEVKAVVQPAAWPESEADLERELIDHCRERLAHFKCPRSVDLAADLPREPTGKLHKRALRDRYR